MDRGCRSSCSDVHISVGPSHGPRSGSCRSAYTSTNIRVILKKKVLYLFPNHLVSFYSFYTKIKKRKKGEGEIEVGC